MSLENRWQIEDIKQRVPLSELIARDVPLIRKSNKLWACCPFHQERTPSFTVDDARCFYKCFGCGAKGDQFQWLQDFKRLDFRAAKAELMRLAGIDPSEWERADPAALRQAQAAREAELEETERRRRMGKVELAHRIWTECVPLDGTAAEVYLRGRGVDMAVIGAMPTIRFHPALLHDYTSTRHPAMVAYIKGPDGHFAGVHRTYLKSDGSEKLVALNPRDGKRVPAKLMLGNAWRGAVRLGKAGRTLAIGEGIETCLSVLQAALASGSDLAVWAAMSLGNIAGDGLGQGGPHPRRDGIKLPSVNPDMSKPGVGLPAETEHVLILADNDNKDPESASAILQRAANRWRAQGRKVSLMVPPKGMDFNDWWRLLQAKGGAA